MLNEILNFNTLPLLFIIIIYTVQTFFYNEKNTVFYGIVLVGSFIHLLFFTTIYYIGIMAIIINFISLFYFKTNITKYDIKEISYYLYAIQIISILTLLVIFH